MLIETSDLQMADVAFASGFSSVRTFNETVQEVFALSPSELRGRAKRGSHPTAPGHDLVAASRSARRSLRTTCSVI